MKRISKKPEDRKLEIMQMAQKLFEVKGYDNVSIEMIINKIGIAKGTFYYYFKSKDEVLEAVVNHAVDEIISLCEIVANDAKLNAVEKLQKILAARILNNDSSSDLKRQLHQPKNELLHEKTNVRIVLKLSPILAEVIEQGNKEGIFKAKNGLETVQVILSAAIFLFDEGLFRWSKEEKETRMEIIRSLLEYRLGAKSGTFDFLK